MNVDMARCIENCVAIYGTPVGLAPDRGTEGHDVADQRDDRRFRVRSLARARAPSEPRRW
jgi:hypothetical protein